MNQKERLFLVSVIVFAIVVMALIINWLLVSRANNQPAAEENETEMHGIVEMAASQTAKAESRPNAMNLVERAASQTAAVLLTEAAPTATLPPDIKYWLPAVISGFSARFTYNSTQWALTDTSTLASLQTGGCTLRLAGGRSLGPGWSTEESSFQTGQVSFVTVLAKYQGTPQFMTYSMPNGLVFEIASAADFEQCLQDGESVLKSVILR